MKEQTEKNEQNCLAAASAAATSSKMVTAERVGNCFQNRFQLTA